MTGRRPTTGKLDSDKWGTRIRLLRKENDWSQAQLADKLGVHAQTISDMERGKHKMTLERLRRTLRALGYEATIELQRHSPKTRAEWGYIAPNEPERRRRIRQARRLAESLADCLYNEFDARDVYCFGSLVADHGSHFTDTSDIDLAVTGLPARDQIDAETALELDVIDSDSEFREFSFDLVRTDQFDGPWSKTERGRNSLHLPPPDDDR